MISKVTIGKTFQGTCRYICMDQKRAMILEVEGVRAHDYKLMAIDFINQQNLRPSLGNAVFHGILSFYPGEKLSDEKMVGIAKEYLQDIGIIDTQYVIAKHVDKNHPHLHLIANLVNNRGEAIKDGWIGLRGKKVAQKLTIKYGLKQAEGKNLALTNLELYSEKEANRYAIYKAVSECLSLSKNLDELKHLLGKRGIETLYKYKGQTKELQGISFKLGEYKYKGSAIDRNYSLKNLERVLRSNKLKQRITTALRNNPTKQLLHDEEAYTKENKMQVSEIVLKTIKPEENFEQIPYELKKKKRRRFHGL